MALGLLQHTHHCGERSHADVLIGKKKQKFKFIYWRNIMTALHNESLIGTMTVNQLCTLIESKIELAALDKADDGDWRGSFTLKSPVPAFDPDKVVDGTPRAWEPPITAGTHSIGHSTDDLDAEVSWGTAIAKYNDVCQERDRLQHQVTMLRVQVDELGGSL